MAVAAEPRIMFLHAQTFDSGKCMRGALLLTDLQTKPLEFRCTAPIRPTALQTVLYGQVLQQHIMVELIGLPLLRSLKEPPQLILVRELELLNLRKKTDVPIVRVTKEAEGKAGAENELSSGQLVSSSGRFEPILLIPHSQHQDDRTVAKSFLAEVYQNHDIAEPFGRISLALAQVHEQRMGEEK